MEHPLKNGVVVRFELTPENSAVEEPRMCWARVRTHIPPSPPVFPEYEYEVEVDVNGEHWMGWIQEAQILEVAE